MAEEKVYSYEGPVEEFGKCIERVWKATTLAVSEKKARNNLTYRYKKDHGRTRTAKITLPGEINILS